MAEDRRELPATVFPGHVHENGAQENPTFPETFYDFLESEFNGLSLSAAPPTSYFMAAPPVLDSVGGASGSTSRNRSSVDFSHGMGFPLTGTQFSFGESLQRMRAQSAARAQLGSHMDSENYQGFGDHQNLDAFSSSRNLDAVSGNGFGNLNNGWRGSNGAAIGNWHLGHQNSDFPYGLNCGNHLNSNRQSNMFAANSHYGIASSYGVDSNNLLHMMSASALPNGCGRQPKSSSLEDVRGHILWAARDQYGANFLLKKLAKGKPEEIQMIVAGLKDHIHNLMMDKYGIQLVQNILKACNEEQVTQILAMVTRNEHILVATCQDIHGSRGMQILLEHLKTHLQKTHFVSVLQRITVFLAKSGNGCHVLQHWLRLFPGEHNKHILSVVAQNCLSIATDKIGCCLLQQCVLCADGEAWEHLITVITENALVLSEDPYGNYVVQYIVGLKVPHVTANVVRQLSGSYASLSMNKYGSNVVEKCMKESGEPLLSQIIEELIDSPNFLNVLQDPFGNYVGQSALDISRGATLRKLISHIFDNHPFLQSHPHGKRVLLKAREYKDRM